MSAVLSLLLSVACTPLPMPRPLRRAEVVGRWDVSWGGMVYDTEFRQDGSYTARCGSNSLYTGSWEVEDGLLLIHETAGLGGPKDCYQDYHFVLDTRSWCGSIEPWGALNSGLPVRMRRR